MKISQSTVDYLSCFPAHGISCAVVIDPHTANQMKNLGFLETRNANRPGRDKELRWYCTEKGWQALADHFSETNARETIATELESIKREVASPHVTTTSIKGAAILLTAIREFFQGISEDNL